jgi:predicted kinase|tara:strand:+ start:85 stop:483 length:399 start_codon:yes stop_codon:yes gene_type:complete
MNPNTLILMRGLPYSGKTTWALRQGHPIVCPDAIRLALGHRFRAENEPLVWGIAKTMVLSLFLAGHTTVIVDATNTTQKRVDEWQSDSWRVEIQEIFTDKEECIARAKRAGDERILPVIERMASQFEVECDV